MNKTNLEEMETQVSSIRHMQDDIQKSCTIMRDAMAKTWLAMKELNSKLDVASRGSIKYEKFDEISITDWAKYMDEEGFVNELASIGNKNSPTMRMAGYLRAVVGLGKCKKSVMSKAKKLEERIDYLVKHHSFGTDYGQSRELHTKVMESLAVIDRRIATVMSKYFDERLGILKLIQVTTNNIYTSVADKDALRTAALKADDRHIMEEIMFKMNTIRK